MKGAVIQAAKTMNKARNRKLTKKRRREIAQQAALARWEGLSRHGYIQKT
jgi:hypothetical protein